MNFFFLLGLEAKYHINPQELTSSFINLQRQYHPDKFVNCSQKEQLAALQQSSMINQAWKILSNPLDRAEHLLSIHGFDLTNGRQKYVLYNTEFLMEQFLLREEIASIEEAKDCIQLKRLIKKIKNLFELDYQQMILMLDNEKWKDAVYIICRLRFLDTLRNSAEQIEEKICNF